MDSEVNQLMFESGECGHKRSCLLSAQTGCVKIYKDNSVAFDELSNIRASFMKAIKTRGEKTGTG